METHSCDSQRLNGYLAARREWRAYFFLLFFTLDFFLVDLAATALAGAFFAGAFLVVAFLADFVATGSGVAFFLPLANALSQPSEYFFVVPTRIIVTSITSLELNENDCPRPQWSR